MVMRTRFTVDHAVEVGEQHSVDRYLHPWCKDGDSK